MTPEIARDTQTRRHESFKRRRSADDQEDGSRGKRLRIETDVDWLLGTPSTRPTSSMDPSQGMHTDAAAPINEILGHTSHSDQQSTNAQKYRPSDAPSLTVVERATVLCKPSPFSTDRQLSVLDISFGSTCQTNFCARVEGFDDMWMAKISCTELCDELFGYVLGEGDTRELCGVLDAERDSSQVMGMHTGGTGFTGDRVKAVHFIAWPKPYVVNTPSQHMDLGREAGLREFVEMIGGCWVE